MRLSRISDRRFGWFRQTTVGLAVVLAIGFAAFLFLLYWNDSQLREMEARLDNDDPGWRLDEIEAAREKIPDAENSALVVVAAKDLLPENWPTVDFVNALAAATANERLRDDDYFRLCNELNEWEAALTEARKLADMPRGRHKIVYKRPNLYLTSLGDQQKCRAVAQLLSYAALRRAQEGDVNGALVDCRAAVNAGRSTGDEPFLITLLIRNACVSVACNTAAAALGQGQPSDTAMAALQKALEENDAHPTYMLALRGERASLHEMVGAVESGRLPFSQVAGGGTIRGESVLASLMRPEFKSEHANILGMMTRFVESSRQPLAEQIATETTVEAEIRSLPRTAVLTRLLIPAVSKVGESCRRTRAYERSLIACLAAERYRQKHGAWPATLADLVPEELSAVPLDPYDGQPLRMRRLADGIVIYSVGNDTTDDGGKLATGTQMYKPGFDFGFRLWDPAHRAQPPKAVDEAAQ
jgi:hypothetical protein